MTAHAEPNIQVVHTRGGLTAWLVESHSIPMISTEIAFRAGAVFDPEDKQGLASLTASLLDEGAGDKDAKAFQEAVENIGARLGAGADKLDFSINLSTLTEKKEEAFALLKEALTNPRFDEEAIERIKDSMLAGIKRSQESAESVAGKTFGKALFEGHVYANSVGGELDTVPSLSRKDVQAFYGKHINKANMVISVVGDINPEELAVLLDDALIGLPEGETRNTVAKGPNAITPQVRRVEKDVPQASVVFGHLGISREHPDYYASYVMNDILGGGGFKSRFMDEVREKRGLAYGVYSYFAPLPYQGSYVAKVSTKNESVQEAITVMKEQIRDIQDKGVSEEEFADSISYLTGSFPLRLDSNSKILGYLTTMQMEDLGVDYMQAWPEKIRSVTRQDVQRVAKELLHPDQMVTVIVGKGEALEAN